MQPKNVKSTNLSKKFGGGGKEGRRDIKCWKTGFAFGLEILFLSSPPPFSKKKKMKINQETFIFSGVTATYNNNSSLIK